MVKGFLIWYRYFLRKGDVAFIDICVMKISFNTEIKKNHHFCRVCRRKQKYHVTALREKQSDHATQNDRVTVVNESASITFDVLVLLEIKCSK